MMESILGLLPRMGSDHKRKPKPVFNFRLYNLKRLPPANIITGEIVCPCPRSGHRIVAKNGNVYVIGGYTPHNADETIRHIVFKELWKYNIASKSWKLLETTGKMPEELASHGAALVGNQLLVFGGTAAPFGEMCNNITFSCNLDTLVWEEFEVTGDPPREQYGQAVTVQGNKLYTVGGTDGFSYSMAVHCLDLSTRVWEHLEPNTKPYDWLPEPRYRHEIAIFDDNLFVFGGGTAYECYSMSEIPVFNLVTRKWSKVPTSEYGPEDRRCHALVQVESDVYICGGLNGNTSFDDVWKIDLRSCTWDRIYVLLPYPLYFHSAAVSEEKQLFVFGGVSDLTTNTRTNELFTMWLELPSLEEMCWQAMLKFAPHMFRVEKSKLYEAGVPYSYLKEVDFESSNTVVAQCCSRLQS